MSAPNRTNTVVWHFQPPAGQSWEIHKFSIIDAINAACNQLPFHEAQEEFELRCGSVAFAVLRQLPQFLKGPQMDDPRSSGPFAWLQGAVPGPAGRDGLAEHEIIPSHKEMSGLSITHQGKSVRIVIVGAPAEFVETAVQKGFKV